MLDVQFVVRTFWPRYVLGKKCEEEIPQLFKQFGCPYTINKSVMMTIGSSHSWPTLLAALAWLKKAIEVCLCHCSSYVHYMYIYT